MSAQLLSDHPPTDPIAVAGAGLLDWAQRNLAAIVSVVFAMGFAWSQFAAVQASLTETRAGLQRLHEDFIDFRLSGVGATKEELVAVVARQRDIDLRQDEGLKFLRDRMIAIQAEFERRLGRGTEAE